LVIDREVVRQEVVELPGVPRGARGKRRRTRQKDELMTAFAMLLKRREGARTNMMCNVPSKPVARLLFEIFIVPPPVVTHRFLKRGLDVDERQMIEQVPNDDPAKLPNGDAPTAKLVLRPQRRAVHIEQRPVEVEEGGGSQVQVVHHGLRLEALTDVLWGARGPQALASASICWLDGAVESWPPTVTNDHIAEILDQVADRLEAQHANIYRIDAYRAGGAVVRDQGTSIQDLALTEGRRALDALPQIGTSLSGSIDEIAHTGRLRLLDRLDGKLSPVELFKTVPGIGEELAERIHRELEIDTLEALEVAAHDGRLDAVAGFGPRRLEAIRDILATILARSARGRARRFEELRQAGARVSAPETVEARPEVSLLLEVDRQYRQKVEADELPRISPQRNNPGGVAWLPILHSYENGWHFTALFSNTDRAHELSRVRDWVVIYFEHDGHEGQCTVVTEYRGPLMGKRIVRGREDEVGALEGLNDH